VTELLAASGVAAALAIPLTAFLRRPSVTLGEDKSRTFSRLEKDVELNDVPFVRLLAHARRGRRAAHGSRVEVVGIRRQTETSLVPLGHWPLAWTSAKEPAVTVYASDERPLDFGVLEHWHPDDDQGGVVYFTGDPVPEGPERHWHLRLVLHGGDVPADRRDRLPPGEWVVRLVVGSEDGSARTYDVHVAWSGDEPDAASALVAVLDRLQVEKV
jgi:hypothetical protein